MDATSATGVAVGGSMQMMAYAVLTMSRCTVFGQVRAHAFALAENSVFYGVVQVARRQQGCMRFCYAMPGSRTPRRYECQPESSEAAAEQELRDLAAQSHGTMAAPSSADVAAARARARLRVRPRFNSMRYGTPTYAQLAFSCAAEITRGADDEAEMGAFHDLFQPQRAANLRARLDEYTPASMEAGVIYVD